MIILFKIIFITDNENIDRLSWSLKKCLEEGGRFNENLVSEFLSKTENKDYNKENLKERKE